MYPYGDPDDDWLNIDVTRGTGRVGDFFSNDQIVGWIDITLKSNPELRDKTNREGLIETGGAAERYYFLGADLLVLYQAVFIMRAISRNSGSAISPRLYTRDVGGRRASWLNLQGGTQDNSGT